jgi:hypothetical protein
MTRNVKSSVKNLKSQSQEIIEEVYPFCDSVGVHGERVWRGSEKERWR